MSDAAKNITDRQVAVKAFADRVVRTNEERIVSNSRTESVFWSREERINVGNVKPELSHASRELENAIGKFFHSEAIIGVPFIKVSDGKNQAER